MRIALSCSKGILSQSSQKLYGGNANASEKAAFKNTRCRQERNADVVVVFPSISGSGNYAAVVVLDTAASNGGCCKMALLFMDTSAIFDHRILPRVLLNKTKSKGKKAAMPYRDVNGHYI